MESSFAFVVNPIEQYTADVPVSKSRGNGRIRVADGSSGIVQVMESAAMCLSDEFTFRLVMTPNAAAGSIDWTVFEYGTYLGYTFPRNVIRACTGCYHNWNLAWTVLVEEFCLPKPLPICLALQVSAKFDVPVKGFAAYLIGGGNATLLMAAEGRGVTGEQYLHAEPEVDCEMDPVPSDCPFPFVIAYQLSNRVDSLYARTSSRGDIVYMKGSNVNVVCRPSPDCDTLFLEDFTIVRGNPNVYFGNYSVFLNGQQIFWKTFSLLTLLFHQLVMGYLDPHVFLDHCTRSTLSGALDQLLLQTMCLLPTRSTGVQRRRQWRRCGCARQCFVVVMRRIDTEYPTNVSPQGKIVLLVLFGNSHSSHKLHPIQSVDAKRQQRCRHVFLVDGNSVCVHLPCFVVFSNKLCL